jgi:hypothetical protein
VCIKLNETARTRGPVGSPASGEKPPGPGYKVQDGGPRVGARWSRLLSNYKKLNFTLIISPHTIRQSKLDHPLTSTSKQCTPSAYTIFKNQNVCAHASMHNSQPPLLTPHIPSNPIFKFTFTNSPQYPHTNQNHIYHPPLHSYNLPLPLQQTNTRPHPRCPPNLQNTKIKNFFSPKFHEKKFKNSKPILTPPPPQNSPHIPTPPHPLHSTPLHSTPQKTP